MTKTIFVKRCFNLQIKLKFLGRERLESPPSLVLTKKTEAKMVIINFVSLLNDESILTLLPGGSIVRGFHHPKLRYAANSAEVKLNLSPENVE